jgi:carbonic anhydrase
MFLTNGCYRKYAERHVPALTREEALKAGGGKRAPIPVVVTCFDARVIPEEFFNLKVGGKARILPNWIDAY